MAAPKIEIPDLALENEIGEGAFNVLYRAKREKNVVAVKLSKLNVTGPQDPASLRFRREGATLARLTHPNLVQVLHMGEIRQRPYMVMEFVDGQPLDLVLRTGPMKEEEVLHLATSVTSALVLVHSHGFLHRDIKPANIMMARDGRVKLVDFGFVAAVDQVVPQNEVVGSMAYSSPEQSGFVKRPVDPRSDLYSLGVVLFECATGKLPFDAPDLSTLIQKHGLERPPVVHEVAPAVSRALSGIIAKLLGKDPDDRYLSSASLLADLQNIEEFNKTLREGGTVLLGRGGKDEGHDSPMVGRKEELRIIEETGLRALSGKGNVFLLSGDSGMGKSRLSREVLRTLAAQTPLFLFAKCSRQDPLPLEPLRVAIESHVQKINLLPPAEKQAQWKLLRDAAGDNAAFLKKFSRSLRTAWSDVADAHKQDAQEQYYDAISEFLLGMARAAGGVVFCLDDIQWLDEASRNILSRLAERIPSAPFFLLATSRNDADSTRALQVFRDTMGASLAAERTLQPLSHEEVGEYVRDLLGGREIDADLTSLIATRSNGSPFTAGEYIRAMLEEGQLQFTWGKWWFDKANIEALSLPADVIHLVIRRLDNLGAQAKSVLRMAALQGNHIQTRWLGPICDIPEAAIQAALTEAAQARLVEREEAGDYVFVHDRICEALVADLPQEDLNRAHQRIATVLDEVGGQGNEFKYAVAHHYAKGVLSEKPRRVYETNLEAGIVASQNYANDRAMEFLTCAEKAAVAANLPPSPHLYSALGEISFRSHENGHQGREYLEKAVACARSRNLRAHLRIRLCKTMLNDSDVHVGQEQIALALEELGHPASKNPVLRMAKSVWLWLVGIAIGWTGIGYGKVRGRKRKRFELLLRAHITSAHTAYQDLDISLLIQGALRGVYIANRLGPGHDQASFLYHYATLIAIIIGTTAKKYVQRGAAIAEQIGDRRLLAESKLFIAYVREFCGEVREGERELKDCFTHFGRWLHWYNFQEGRLILSWGLALRGYVHDAWHWAEEAVISAEANLDRKGHDKGAGMSAAYGAAWLVLQGRLSEGHALMKKATHFHNTLQKDLRFVWGCYYSFYLLYLLEVGEIGAEADAVCEDFYRHLRLNTLQILTPVNQFYLYQTYLRLAQCQRAEGAEKKRRLKQYKKALSDLKGVISSALTLTAHHATLMGGYYWQNGNRKKALAWLDRAQGSAEKFDVPWAGFEAIRIRALMLQEQGLHDAAKRWAQVALSQSNALGFVNHSKQIRQEFKLDNTGSRSIHTAFTSSSQRLSTTSEAHFALLEKRLNALLQVSLVSASTFDPETQIKVVLDEIVKILGAERGYLFLLNEENEKFQMRRGRSHELQDLTENSGYSTDILERVRGSLEPVIVRGDERLSELSASIVANDLRSIMAVPLLLGDKLKGVVYLDNRFAKGVFTEENLDILQALANQIAVALETVRTAALELDRLALKKDLEVAGAVQSLLMPKESAWKSSELDLVGYSQPATQSGGDWWCYDPLPDGRLLVLMGDVSGHGAGPAMVTAIIAGSYRSLRADDLAKKQPLDVGQLLHRLGSTLEQLAGEYWMTMGALLFDPKKKAFQFWSAGAPSPVVIKADGEIKFLHAAGNPLGCKEWSVTEFTEPFESGDRLFLFTDGIPEMTLPTGKELGDRMFNKLLKKTQGKSVDQALQDLIADLKDQRKTTPLADDCTMLIVDCHAPKK